MEREQFSQRFHEAAARARRLAQLFVHEDLPEPLRFRVELNCSFDGHPLRPDQRVFPEDSRPERALPLICCSADEAIDVLWRDGRVPEWIDFSVVARLANATSIEALCCGRYTDNDVRLYHQREGYPPFHVLSPALPFDYQQGQKFSLFRRTECCTLDDFGQLEAHARKIVAVTLQGPVFDDLALAKLPRLRKMEYLLARFSPLRGPGLQALAKQPKLRGLTLQLHDVDSFSLQWLPKLRSLRSITLESLPPGDWAGPRFARRFRRLTSLRLESKHPLELPHAWPRALTELRIAAPELRGGPVPTNVRIL